MTFTGELGSSAPFIFHVEKCTRDETYKGYRGRISRKAPAASSFLFNRTVEAPTRPFLLLFCYLSRRFQAADNLLSNNYIRAYGVLNGVRKWRSDMSGLRARNGFTQSEVSVRYRFGTDSSPQQIWCNDRGALVAATNLDPPLFRTSDRPPCRSCSALRCLARDALTLLRGCWGRCPVSMPVSNHGAAADSVVMHHAPIMFLRAHRDSCAGVQSFEVSLEEQKVTVKGDVTPEAVLEKVAKTGKKTELWTS